MLGTGLHVQDQSMVLARQVYHGAQMSNITLR